VGDNAPHLVPLCPRCGAQLAKGSMALYIPPLPGVVPVTVEKRQNIVTLRNIPVLICETNCKISWSMETKRQDLMLALARMGVSNIHYQEKLGTWAAIY
jgi:hypothetical protein